MGHLFVLVGDIDIALEHLREAIALAPSASEQVFASLETIAHVRLMMNETQSCGELLTQIEESVPATRNDPSYVYRYSRLTRARCLAREIRWDEALESVDSAIELAQGVGDGLLLCQARIVLAEILAERGQASSALRALEQVGAALLDYPDWLHADYEGAFGLTLSLLGRNDAAEQHFRRAARIVDSTKNALGKIHLGRLRQRARTPQIPRGVMTGPRTEQPAHNALHNLTSALMHTGRPELFAVDLVAVLADSESVHCAEAYAVDRSRNRDLLARYGEWKLGIPARSIFVHGEEQLKIEVRTCPRSDPESVAALNSIALLVKAAQELQQGRAEREERTALWPTGDLPVDGGDAIVRGRLRNIMIDAQKAAATSAIVLITGESGTGKEILARAIHACSARATKPFVPFNCTAVPRDLLESQLFGYRRGAFTGADRDYPGLIRAAAPGTLFLDEIGELGLDLQPKLLRFLESGEIAPLGTAGAQSVDVRIIASTNANLEQLVQEGRFREDLFYRLNVIRFTIPPLRERRDEIPELVHHFTASAAREFDKGSVRIAEETMERLLLHAWPGNIRQLHNELRRMVAFADRDSTLMPDALSPDIGRPSPSGEHASRRDATAGEFTTRLTGTLETAISRLEHAMISAALQAHPKRMDAAARSLGISRKGLYLKRQRLGI